MTNIYYLPGCGGRLGTGLGAALLQHGFNVSGRQTIGDFRALPFDKKVAVVADDLHHQFWCSDAKIHIRTEDWQSVPDNVQAFGRAVGIPVHLAQGLGHMLGENYVEPLLDRWLAQP